MSAAMPYAVYATFYAATLDITPCCFDIDFSLLMPISMPPCYAITHYYCAERHAMLH